MVITGVSSGIGLDTARLLIEHKFHVFGSVRRCQDADRLRQELGAPFTPLLFDVVDAEAIQRASHQVQAALAEESLAGLINNAGISITGPLMHIPPSEMRQQLEVNVMGLLQVTQAFLPMLGARRGSERVGRLINVSSVFGEITLPYFGAYAASKHAVESMSDAFRRELTVYGIPVSVVQPGAIHTPIWDKLREPRSFADTRWDGSFACTMERNSAVQASGLPPRHVSRAILHALTARRPRTRYVMLPGGWRKRVLGWWLPRWLPDEWLDRRVCIRA